MDPEKESLKKSNQQEKIQPRKKREYIPFYWHKLYFKLTVPLCILGSSLIILVLNRDLTKLENIYHVEGIEEGYFGFYKDVQDSQWRSFQNGLGEIFIVATIFTLISRYLRNNIDTQKRISNLINFNLLFGIGFAGYLFHIGLIYYVFESFLSFLLIKLFVRHKTIFPILLWVSQLLILYTNEMMDGYGFQWINSDKDSIWYTLDRDLHDGSEIRWHVMYNLTVLKIISFGMDQYWSLHNISKFNKKNHTNCIQCDNNQLCYKARQEQNIELSNFTFSNYLAYLTYTPLFIAGPITTFNSWISHIKSPQTTYDKKGLIKYVLRTIFVLITFEIWTHLSHSFAILTNPKNAELIDKVDLMTLGTMSLFALIFIWYKFMSIWRVFRTWALLDGFETPENMNRCMCNNYCFEGFWRSWHRSFNQWLIRYIFIPCGGSKYKQYNIWVVFTFVAVWHDINLNLIIWAWVICIALVPEMAVKAIFSQQKYNHLWKNKYFKFLCGIAGGIDITLMVFANLVGFGNGKDGMELIMGKLMCLEGLWSYIKLVSVLTPTAVLMYAIRDREAENEKNKGF